MTWIISINRLLCVFFRNTCHLYPLTLFLAPRASTAPCGTEPFESFPWLRQAGTAVSRRRGVASEAPTARSRTERGASQLVLLWCPVTQNGTRLGGNPHLGEDSHAFRSPHYKPCTASQHMGACETICSSLCIIYTKRTLVYATMLYTRVRLHWFFTYSALYATQSKSTLFALRVSCKSSCFSSCLEATYLAMAAPMVVAMMSAAPAQASASAGSAKKRTWNA